MPNSGCVSGDIKPVGGLLTVAVAVPFDKRPPSVEKEGAKWRERKNLPSNTAPRRSDWRRFLDQ